MAKWEEAPLLDALPSGVPAPRYASAPEVMAGPDGGLAPLNMDREAGMGTRAMLGLKLGSEGKARYLESQYGVGNVVTAPDGRFFVKDKGQFIPVDSDALNTSDVADLSGAAVAAAPAIAAAPFTGGMSLPMALGAEAGLGLVGSVAQQAMGVLTPGGDPMSLSDRGVQAAIDAGAAGLGAGGARALSRAYSGPRNAIVKQMGKLDTPMAREGKAVESFLGVPLSPGQISQRRSLLTLEGALRRSPTKAGDIMADMDTRQLTAARERWDDLLSRINASPQQADLYGGQVQQAFDATVNRALKVLDSSGRRDFAILDQAAGRTPMFGMNNAIAAVDDLIARYDVPGAATDSTKSTVRQLREVRDALSNGQTPTPKSAAEMQRLLSSWGGAATGSQKLFPDLGEREQRGIAKRVFGALQDDLNAAAATDPAVAGALKTARDNYRANMQAVDELKKSAIGQYLGFRDTAALAPEQIADRVAGMKPTQLRQTFNLLGQADPELAGATKRYMLERAMTAAEPSEEKIAQAVGAGTTPEAYSPAKLMSSLAKSPVMEVLSPEEKFAVQMLNSSFARLANRGGTEGSPTAPLMWAMDIGKNLMTAGLAGDVVGGAKLAATMIGPTRIAEAIASPKQTMALKALVQPNATRETILASLGTLGLMEQSRAGGEDVRPTSMRLAP